MGMRIRIPIILMVIFLLTGNMGFAADLPLHELRLPEGFTIALYARVPGARQMALGPEGNLFVGSRAGGKVFLVRDLDQDMKGDEVVEIASGLNNPNGVAFVGSDLYVAEIHRVIRFPGILSKPPGAMEYIVVNDSLPRDKWHGWKYIRQGPDGKLYFPIGAPCNVCVSKDPRYATIMRMDPDGSHLGIFARGVRNTVGFDWHPVTGELWFTDNGRDWLGDDLPPDELNRSWKEGLDFGFPYCHGRNIPDPEFDSSVSCSDFVPPVMELGPHVAALGMRFYRGEQFPREYLGRIFIAEHGSWNRTEPIGYRITMVSPDGNRAASYKIFIEGWLDGNRSWGRPVDIVELPDGSILISDDTAGAIYRVSYSR